ncbi:MAG: HEAT repeat domain-containing protein [Pirellulales bacterium]|nr:HEAT repeat domain-containing protein [Pirellulales bacterium]
MNGAARVLGGLTMIVTIWGPARVGWTQPTIPKNRIPAGLPSEIQQQFESLYATDPRQRADAAGRLRGHRDVADHVIPFLVAMLHDAETLYGEEALRRRSLISSFASRFPEPNSPGEVAARALATMRTETVGPHLDLLIARLREKDPHTRANVLRAFGEMPRLKDRRVMRPLIEVLDDPHPTVRQYAATVLAGAEDLPLAEAVAPLLANLGHREADVRAAAAKALGAAKDARAVDPLIGILADRNEEAHVRGSAAGALSKIDDPRRVEPLIVAAGDQQPALRKAAAAALAAVRDPRAAPPLIAALGDEDRQVREVTAGALGRYDNHWAVEPLIAALEDEYPNVRAQAAHSLGELGDPRALKPLLDALKDPNSYVRWHAATGLGELKHPRAKASLTEALQDESEVVRRAAERALKAIDRTTRI